MPAARHCATSSAGADPEDRDRHRVYGVLWVLLSYARGGNPFTMPWQRPAIALIGIMLASAKSWRCAGSYWSRYGEPAYQPDSRLCSAAW